MSFGYELSATALQVVTAYATIANGGVLMQPRVVKSIRNDDGTLHTAFEPQRIRQVISTQTAATLSDILVGVVERGTGREARIPGVRIAGKTGTAQQITDGTYSRRNYTASFVGYYPADNPRVAMIVMLDRPTLSIYGGGTAAPIFKRIVQKTMTMLQLDAGTQKKIAASTQADTVIVPDVRGLTRETADSVLHRLSLRTEMPHGSGVITKQEPPAGARRERGSIVTVHGQVQQGSTPQRPDVVGFPLRRAVTVLHAAGYEVKIKGSGRVMQQQWVGTTCVLLAQ
jgi:stage V sporulation protein D (sporulation-specific penicillin-binding protein)